MIKQNVNLNFDQIKNIYKKFIISDETQESTRYFKRQIIFKFENLWGASLLFSDVSDGLELAVIRFTTKDSKNYYVRYETEICEGMLTNLDIDKVYFYLEKIQNLNEG